MIRAPPDLSIHFKSPNAFHGIFFILSWDVDTAGKAPAHVAHLLIALEWSDLLSHFRGAVKSHPHRCVGLDSHVGQTGWGWQISFPDREHEEGKLDGFLQQSIVSWSPFLRLTLYNSRLILWIQIPPAACPPDPLLGLCITRPETFPPPPLNGIFHRPWVKQEGEKREALTFGWPHHQLQKP